MLQSPKLKCDCFNPPVASLILISLPDSVLQALLDMRIDHPSGHVLLSQCPLLDLNPSPARERAKSPLLTSIVIEGNLGQLALGECTINYPNHVAPGYRRREKHLLPFLGSVVLL